MEVTFTFQTGNEMSDKIEEKVKKLMEEFPDIKYNREEFFSDFGSGIPPKKFFGVKLIIFFNFLNVGRLSND